MCGHNGIADSCLPKYHATQEVKKKLPQTKVLLRIARKNFTKIYQKKKSSMDSSFRNVMHLEHLRVAVLIMSKYS